MKAASFQLELEPFPTNGAFNVAPLATYNTAFACSFGVKNLLQPNICGKKGMKFRHTPPILPPPAWLIAG